MNKWLTVFIASLIVIVVSFTSSDSSDTIGGSLGNAISAPIPVPQKQTYFYYVTAVNAVGESAPSNEVKSVVVPLTDFQQFVTDAQGAAYYSKWAHDNPNDLARWVAYRDAILNSQTPQQPTMSTKYGAGLVDAGKLFLDYALGS